MKLPGILLLAQCFLQGLPALADTAEKVPPSEEVQGQLQALKQALPQLVAQSDGMQLSADQLMKILPSYLEYYTGEMNDLASLRAFAAEIVLMQAGNATVTTKVVRHNLKLGCCYELIHQKTKQN